MKYKTMAAFGVDLTMTAIQFKASQLGLSQYQFKKSSERGPLSNRLI